MKKGYKIISLEAKRIYQEIQAKGPKVGFKLPEKKDFLYFSLFKNVLDYSLDLIELESAYKEICGGDFSFSDEMDNQYTLAVINVKFNSKYNDEKKAEKSKNLKELREYFYKKGFYINGLHYVRYKRSSGSSRQGKCLFIDERLKEYMETWGECALKPSKDIASWEAYKALSLSAIKGMVKIPLEGILFIPDAKSIFEDEVICVEDEDGKLVAKKKSTSICNDIWDGESLLDESLFEGEYAERHMLLLRNKFFKTCAFKTRLQKWFGDKKISIEELKSRGFITLATDVSQIVMVTTPNSMKFLKFMSGGLTENNVKAWLDCIHDDFGVVKYDKRTKFFNGRLVQTSYQFLNTLAINAADAEQLLIPSINYIDCIRRDYDFMRYHFSDAYKREIDGEKREFTDGLAERSEVIFKLMKINADFQHTKLYYKFRNEVTESQKNRLKEGHILLSGTNATLFGNGPEMLLALSGEFDIQSPFNQPIALAVGEVACQRFSDEKELVCVRSPHITMGNLYYAKNNLKHDLWQYFDLGNNIICVNAIGENIQQRLNGCDYDSDSMLVTDDAFIVDVVRAQDKAFCVPVCSIKSNVKDKQSLAELDHSTSENKIGDIVNLSQKLNSILWNKLYEEDVDQDMIDEIYKDICVLAVLSGIEIDKAKRAYDVVVGSILTTLHNKYGKERPEFFESVDSKRIEKQVRRIYVDKEEVRDQQERKKELEKRRQKAREEFKQERAKKYCAYNTAMQYVYQCASKLDFRMDKPKKVAYKSILDIIREPEKAPSTVYKQRDRVIARCNEYKDEISALYKKLNSAEEDEKDAIYEQIQQQKIIAKASIDSLLCNEHVVYLVLKHYEKTHCENWHLYAHILENEQFIKMLKESKEKMSQIAEDVNGEYELYGKKYSKTL